MAFEIDMKPIKGKDVYGKNCVHAYKLILDTSFSHKEMEFDYQYDEKLRNIIKFVGQMQEYYENKIEELENG